MDKFILTIPKLDQCDSGIIRLRPAVYQSLLAVKRQTGLPIGTIAEKCIRFALARLIITEEDENADA